MLAATMMGGSIGQSVYAATGTAGSQMEHSMKKQDKTSAINRLNENMKGDIVGGDIDDGTSWRLELGTGTLSITGQGKPNMDTTKVDSDGVPIVPWRSYSSSIKKVVIEKGVQPVNMDGWFAHCTNLTEIEATKLPEGLKSCNNTFRESGLKKAPQLPDSLENGNLMFYDCESLEEAPRLPRGLRNGHQMFKYCYTIKVAPELPERLQDGGEIFSGCSKLKKIKGELPASMSFKSVGDTGSYEGSMYSYAGYPDRASNPEGVIWLWYKAKSLQQVEWKNREVRLYCTVGFRDANGKIIKEADVSLGRRLDQEEVPEAPKGYHWDVQKLQAAVMERVSDDVILKAEKNEYTVTFKDWDGKVLSDQKVTYQDTAKVPENPARTGYTFTGWDKTFDKVTGDLTVTAEYKKNEYTVAFKDWDGKILSNQKVTYEDTAKAPENPARTGYTFTGWDKTFDKVIGDLTVTAEYKKNAVIVVKPSVSVMNKQVLTNKEFQIKVNRKIKGAAVSYKTGNKKVASVSKTGFVKGVSDGKTVITTTVKQGGKTYSFKTNVTVKGFVKFLKTKKTIKKGKSYSFKAQAYGTGNKKLKWSVSNKKIGKITKAGKFKAIKKGKVYVIVKSGKYQAKIKVNVK